MVGVVEMKALSVTKLAARGFCLNGAHEPRPATHGH